MQKRKLLLTAMCLISASAFAFGFTACKNDKPNDEPHAHNWSAWTVSETNKPTETTEGKATRTCTGTGDCDATETDTEYTLPVLTSADYSKTADTATCSAAGVITYTYNKDGVNLSFDIATSVNAEAHNYGSYTYTDGTGHYKVCGNNAEHKTAVEPHDTDGEDGACSKCGYKATTVNPPTPPVHDEHTWGEWTVTTIPTKVMPGTATRTCTYDGCDEVDTEVLELPPLASTLAYTITDNTASCTAGGTATYTFTDDNENTVSFTAATDAKGHKYGDYIIVNGVPKSICSECQEEVEAPMAGTITPSQAKATFFAGGDLEYTLTANGVGSGYYIFTYEGEKEINVDYTYITVKDGEISDTAILSASDRTSIIIYLDDARETCVMKITSTEESAFIGEMSLEFSDRDPSHVTPQLSLGQTTVAATYYGTVYEFTAPVSGNYILTCDSEEAVIIVYGTAEILDLPYTFTLAKDATISFEMCCEEETAEYNVQVVLGLSGSGTFSDPYLITEDFFAVNIGATIKNGETKYYKIAMSGEFFINCLPIEAGGTYPTFLSDEYTSEIYSAEISIAEETISVTGWRVTGIVSDDGFIFALTASGADATDNVQLYVNSTYGSEKNPYDWVTTYYFMDYKYYSNYEVGDTVYIDFEATVSSRVTFNFAHISTVIYNGKTMTTDGSSFEMFVVEGETYTFVCTTSYLVNGAELKKTKASVTELDNGSIDVTIPATSGIEIDENVFFVWWTYSEGSAAVPYKITENGEVELFANGSTFVTVAENQYVTFNFGSGITAMLNGTPITSGTRYSLTTEDLVEFVNAGAAVTVSYTVAESLGIESNPYLISENTEGDIEVYANENYFVRAVGNFELVLTFSGVTITCDGKTITSGTEFRANSGDIFVIENSGNSVATVSYTATAILGSKNNPRVLAPETSEDITESTYFTVTITGDGLYQIVISNPVSEKVMEHAIYENEYGVRFQTEEEYAIYGVIIEYNGFYYAFDANGILCEVDKLTDNIHGNTFSQTTAIYNNGKMGNAYVASKGNIPLYLTEGTYILRVVKNSGEADYLKDMSIGCTLTLENTSVKKYTVDFVTNKDGVTVEAQQIEVGETATMVTPECDGYVFYAWYTDAEFKNKFDFTTKIGKDTTLYAFWIESDGLKSNPITAVEGENGGTIYCVSEFEGLYSYYWHYYEYTVINDGELTISIVKGSNVAVNATLESFETLNSLVTFISDGANRYEVTITIKANQTLYLAVCNMNVGRNGIEYGDYTFTITVVKDYTVEFVTNKDGVTVDSQTVKSGNTVTVPETPVCEGFTFEGWYTDIDLTEKFDFTTKISGDMTLYANWKIKSASTDGSEGNPFTVEATNSGEVGEDDFEEHTYIYAKYYIYVAEENCEITLTPTGTRTNIMVSTEGFDDAKACNLYVAEKNGVVTTYRNKGNEEVEGALTISLSAGDTLYLIAGSGSLSRSTEYSFTFEIKPASTDGSEGNPFTVEATNNGEVGEDDFEEHTYIYAKYYIYVAEENCEITLTPTGTRTNIMVSTEGFDDAKACNLYVAEKNGVVTTYRNKGNEEVEGALTISLSAGDTLYLIAGSGSLSRSTEYSFTVDIT